MNFFTLQTTSFVDQITIEGSVEAKNSSSVVCPSRIDGIVLFIIEDGTQVKEGDTVCIVENREIINYYELLVDKVEQSTAQYSKGKADLDMAYALLMAQVESNEAQTAIANLDSLQLQYLPEYQRKIKSLQLEIANVEKQKFKKKLEFLELINESELKKLELQIKQDQNQANDIKETLDGMTMLAPRSGMALRSQLPHTGEKVMEGDEIWEGVKVVDIPDMSKVNVKIMATETQYKRIAENNDVVFIFDAMPGNRAWGKIIKKATMGQPISRNSKIRHFEITASIDSFMSLPEIGISAQCNIISTNIPDTIVVPQLAIFDEDSSKVVYVKMSRNSFEKRQVVLGNYSPRSAIIAAGLQGNETVSFVKPKASKVISHVNLPDSILQKHRQTYKNFEMNNVPSDFNSQSDDYDEGPSFVIFF
ncbi:MAG TPA: efflux RND transporter periplasmic adaptor subunit [Prolixibacteraceae bacterium]|nr:efflux RND transporter periplasmic adaptor subunit [Prolixibacteraceae bacterium]